MRSINILKIIWYSVHCVYFYNNKIERYQYSKDVFISIKTSIRIIQNTIILLKICNHTCNKK